MTSDIVLRPDPGRGGLHGSVVPSIADAVFDALADAVVVTSVAGEVLMANEAASRMFGVGLQPGGALAAVLPNGVIDLLPSWWSGAVAGAELLAWTGEGKSRDGGVVQVTSSGVVLSDRLALALVCRDITASSRALDQLITSEARLAAVVDSVDTGLLVFDRQGRVVMANSTVAELVGVADTEQMLGARAQDIVRGPVRDADGNPAVPGNRELLAALDDGDASVRTEIRVGSDSKGRWLRVGATRIETFGDSTSDSVVSIIDVSEEHELREALAESAERFRVLAEHAPVGIFTADMAGVLAYANRTWLDLTGFTLDEMEGRSALQVVHPDDRERAQRTWTSLQPGDGSVTVELRVVARHETVRYVRCDLAPMPGGSVLGAVVDITDRRRLEERLAREASHDHLTGLPNRAYLDRFLEEGMENAAATGAWPTVLFIDLDHFKEVNDGHGHAAGDAVLREAARRLRGAVRDDDVVARFGGDEFVVVCLPSEPAGIDVIAQRLVMAVGRPYRLVGRIDARIGASVGIAPAGPGMSARQVLRLADAAAYEAKSAGRGMAVWARG